MTTTTVDNHVNDHDDDHHDHGPPAGIKRWLFSTNHKDIGTMYLIFSLIMFFVGGAMAMVIRSELAMPGLQFVHAHDNFLIVVIALWLLCSRFEIVEYCPVVL